MPAYRDLEARGAERCSLVQLAGRTVEAPVVGTFAGPLVVAELVKLANGGPNTALLDLHLRSPDQMTRLAKVLSLRLIPGVARIEQNNAGS